MRVIRFLFALVVCLSVFLFVAGTTLLVRLALPGTPERRRARLFAWQEFWTPSLLRLFCLLVGLRLAYTLPPQAPPGPFIALANHRSWLDIFLLTGALHRLGSFRLTAIVKQAVARMPVLGRFARGIRCAVISRNKDRREDDLERIRQCARDSAEDGATVVIFPEGTRNLQADTLAVQAAKIGGFAALTETLPDWPVLTVVVKWPPGVRVRTLLEGATLVGATIPVEAVIVPRAGRSPSDVLAEAMTHMERRLSTQT